MDVDSNNDDGIKSPSMMEKKTDTDNESGTPRTTANLSEGVTLAAADSTTPEVDTHLEKV